MALADILTMGAELVAAAAKSDPAEAIEASAGPIGVGIGIAMQNLPSLIEVGQEWIKVFNGDAPTQKDYADAEALTETLEAKLAALKV